MHPLSETWEQVTRLLLAAHRELPKGRADNQLSRVTDGFLQGTTAEFHEFLNHNELELAWDALVAVAERVAASPNFWSYLAAAAALMKLSAKSADAARQASRAISGK